MCFTIHVITFYNGTLFPQKSFPYNYEDLYHYKPHQIPKTSAGASAEICGDCKFSHVFPLRKLFNCSSLNYKLRDVLCKDA